MYTTELILNYYYSLQLHIKYSRVMSVYTKNFHYNENDHGNYDTVGVWSRGYYAVIFNYRNLKKLKRNDLIFRINSFYSFLFVKLDIDTNDGRNFMYVANLPDRY